MKLQYKLCRVKKISIGLKGIPYAVTHDGRTIRYIHPDIKVHDTLRVDVATGKILDFVKFDVGRRVMITGGHNIGRVGTIVNRERHPGSHEIVHIKDVKGNSFATRIDNVFVIGTNDKLWITITKDQGIRRGVISDREARLAKRIQQ
jgi:small subunit ribosomal protein S4e